MHQAQNKTADQLAVRDDDDDIMVNEDTLNDQIIRMDKSLLKLFKATCENGQMSKALDLASRLQLDKSFGLAIKISQHYRNRQLAERLDRIRTTRLEEKEDFVEEYHQQEPRNVAEARHAPVEEHDNCSISPTIKRSPTTEDSDDDAKNDDEFPVPEDRKKPLKNEWASIFKKQEDDQDDDQDEVDNSVSRKYQEKKFRTKRKGPHTDYCPALCRDE